MKITISIFFGTLLVFMTVFSFLGCNKAAYDTKAAWNYYRETVDALENSHFRQEVIEQMVQQGEEQGYDITIQNDGMYEDISRYQVKLCYTITIPIVRVEKMREICGYAL
ncbi:MAG: hypothetical protein UHS41_02450 [Lachnospiraceae bacterium]|nr:hypothetical protein [Lachnospiraceae bacterium]